MKRSTIINFTKNTELESKKKKKKKKIGKVVKLMCYVSTSNGLLTPKKRV